MEIYFEEKEPKTYVDPLTYDVSLLDVKDEHLVGPIAALLEVEYLGKPEQTIIDQFNPKQGIYGILYGSNYRPMINLLVSSKRFKKHPINIIFLLDTVSPSVFICKKAMDALGFNDFIPQENNPFNVLIAGETYEAYRSNGHFNDINILGSNFLKKALTAVSLDYAEETFKITARYPF
jgi:hypothetical protein